MDSEHQQSMQFWAARFRNGQFGSYFPADRPRRDGLKRNRACTSAPISHAAWVKFAEACGRESVETLVGALCLLQVLLRRYNWSDVIENGVETDQVFVLATDIACSAKLREHLLTVDRAMNTAQFHACSREELQASAESAGMPADSLPFRVLVSVTGGAQRNQAGCCDLDFALRQKDDAYELEADYDTALYSHETVDRILSQFVLLIESFDALLDVPVDQISLCRSEEAALLMPDLAVVVQPSVSMQCIQRRFEDQVRKTPDNLALILPGAPRQEMTYAELNARSNQLARYLQSKGVGPDVLVGLYLDRTPDLIVAMLAILKAGGAYLPIDLSYPPERVTFMLSDSEAPVVITDSQTAQKLAQTRAAVVRMDVDRAAWSGLSAENVSTETTPDNLAYSIFTSGSTGKPKGVLITHANVSRLFASTDHWFYFGEQDAWTFFHSSAFDFSVWEIWGALLYGGRLVIVPFADSRAPERFYDLLASERVTVLNQTPSAFRQLVGVDEARPASRLKDLRVVIFGGEALNLQSLAPWFGKYGDQQPQLVNMYGITETTVHVTYRPLATADLTEAPGSVIGVPIRDLQVYVLDAAMRPVPVGIPGEMFVGGAGVARGYLKRDELTAARFVQNPFSSDSNAKLYRSGDLARRLPGGDLEYMGRMDQQVKIRGFRIELGEVQSALTRQPSVREAFVTVKDIVDDEKTLVAYVVPSNGSVPAVDKLRRDLQTLLPTYMVPSSFVFLDYLPLTSNGKIDPAALPAAENRRSVMEQAFQAPQNDLERSIARVYQEVLGIDKVGVDDDFFDLGGNSLRLVEVHTEVQKVIGRNFSVADLFVHTTVRKLAASFHHAGQKRANERDLLFRAQRQREAMMAGRNPRR